MLAQVVREYDSIGDVNSDLEVKNKYSYKAVSITTIKRGNDDSDPKILVLYTVEVVEDGF